MEKLFDTSNKPHEFYLRVAADRGAEYPCSESGRPCQAHDHHDYKDMTLRHFSFFMRCRGAQKKLPIFLFFSLLASFISCGCKEKKSSSKSSGESAVDSPMKPKSLKSNRKSKRKSVRKSIRKTNVSQSSDQEFPSTGVLFVSERVVMDVEDATLKVEGTYNFKNPSPAHWSGRIAYPIYVSESQPAPEEVVLEGKDEPLRVRCRKPGECLAVLFLKVSAGETKPVKLSYEQPLKENRAVYLLTTAKKWDRPLQRAELVVKINKNYKNIQLSYPSQKEETKGSKKVFTTIREEFVPQKELEVSWGDPAHSAKAP